MRTNELKEALERLEGVNDSNLRDCYEELKELVDNYDINYSFEEFITQEEALDKIAEICSYGSIEDITRYINGVSDNDLYKEDWDELYEVDNYDMNNIIDEIRGEIERELEKEKEKELREKLSSEIKQFLVECGIVFDPEGKLNVDTLVDKLLSKFKIELKDEETKED